MADPSLPVGRFTPGDFRIGRAFSRSWSVFWRNVVKFSLVTGVAALPTLLFPGAGAGSAVASPGLFFIGLALMLLLNMFAQAVIYYGTLQHMLSRPISLGEGLRVSLGRLLPLIGLGIIGVLVMIGLVLIAGLVLFFAVGSGNPPPLVAFLFVILLLILFALLMVLWSMSGPVCVVERAGAFRSLGRSRDLTKGHRWKILGLLLLVIVPGFLVSAVVSGISAAVVVLAVAGGFSAAVSHALSLVCNALWSAFFAVILAVAYRELRVAKEGIDTDQIAAVFE